VFTHLTKRTYVVLGGSVLAATVLSPALVHCVYGQKIQPGPIARSARIFIDPMDGFGPELQKAFLKDAVPLVIVSDKGSADFEITGEIRNATEPTIQIGGNRGNREDLVDSQRVPTPFVRVRIVNLKTMSMAWGYGTTGFPDLSTAAEACAKRLKYEMKHRH